jgi:hypothetical protein
MTLPWVRIDTNLASHPKILNLLDDPSAKRWQAFASYICAIGWSADRGTNGTIPTNALRYIHATPVTARLLVKYGLWHEDLTGWVIHNFAERQQMTAEASAKRQAMKRAACKRWHLPTCWSETLGCRGMKRDDP